MEPPQARVPCLPHHRALVRLSQSTRALSTTLLLIGQVALTERVGRQSLRLTQASKACPTSDQSRHPPVGPVEDRGSLSPAMVDPSEERAVRVELVAARLPLQPRLPRLPSVPPLLSSRKPAPGINNDCPNLQPAL